MSASAKTESLSRINLPAAQNLTTELFAALSELGLSIVIVFFDGIKQGHPALNRGNLAEKLGRDLEEAHAGSYDSTFYHPGQHWYLYHASDLGKAVEALKAGLDRRGLLKYARIFHAETPNELMTYWPPTAEKIVYSA